MKIIVGLGNPEPKYNMTRHNIGFMCINHIVFSTNLSYKTKFKSEYAETNINGEKIIFIKPLTYMNLSGEAVIKFVDFYNLDLEDLIILYDDKDLNFGEIKIKTNSSHGGHNGMRNIIQHLKTKNIKRVKIGIKTPYMKDTKNFVLGKFSKEEEKELGNTYIKVEEIVKDFIINSDIASLTNKHH